MSAKWVTWLCEPLRWEGILHPGVVVDVGPPGRDVPGVVNPGPDVRVVDVDGPVDG